MPVAISGCRSLDLTVDGVETTGHGCTVQTHGAAPSGAVDDHGDGTCTLVLHIAQSARDVSARLDEIAGRLSERTPVTSDNMRAIGIDDALEAMARGRS